MKKILLLFLIALVSQFVQAVETVKINGVRYTLSGTNATVSSFQSNCSGDIVILPTFTHNGVDYTVIGIEDYAFEFCENMTSVLLPEGLQSIGCEAFFGCSGLTSLTIPNSVTMISELAFLDCSGLTSVSIGSGLTNFEKDTFSGCYGLTSITVSPDNTVFDSRNNCNAIIKTQSNTLIYGCQGTVLPETITAIGAKAFFCGNAPTSLTIPKNVKIGDDAFFGCSGLTSLTINSVKTIGLHAFDGCKDLTFVTIGSGVPYYPSLVSCNKLAFITVSPDNPYYDSRNNCNAIIRTSSNELVVGCKNTKIPETVTSIGSSAFRRCILNSVTIPISVNLIHSSAFYDCYNLKDVFILSATPPTVSDDAFSEIESDAVLHVPNPANYQGNWREWFSSVTNTFPPVYDVVFDGYTWPVGGQECDYDLITDVPGIKNIKVEYGQQSGEWTMFYEPPYVPGPNENFQLHITISLYEGFNFAAYGNYGYILMDNGTWQTCNSTTSVSDTEYTYIWNVRASVPEGGIDIPIISLYVFDPVVGQAPYNGILSIMPFSGNLKGCLSSGVSWMVLENGYWYVMDPGELFENLKSYRVKIDLKTMSGYNFIADAPAFVNGHEAEYVISNDDPGKAYVWYDFMYIGIPTDITAPQVQDTPAAWYSLDGRKFDKQPLQKGIYIHGGKKVVVK